MALEAVLIAALFLALRAREREKRGRPRQSFGAAGKGRRREGAAYHLTVPTELLKALGLDLVGDGLGRHETRLGRHGG